MALDPKLLEILACPETKAPLYYFDDEGFLFCAESRRKYEIRDDIPVMLVEESVQVDADEASAILAKAEERGIAPNWEPA